MKPDGLRALFVLSPALMTAYVLRGWLRAGHGVAAVWCTERDAVQFPRRMTPGGLLFPAFDAGGVLRRAGVVPRRVPLLRDWPEAIEAARASGADVLISSVTMQRIPADLIALFGGRAVNFHPSLLPAYRGPNPLQGMLIDGAADRFGGVTLHMLDEGLDTGAIIAQRACPRAAASGLIDWQHRLAEAAGDLAGRALPAYLRGEVVAVRQDGAVASWRKLGAGEMELGAHLGVAQIMARFDAFGDGHVQRWREASGKVVAVTAVAREGGAREDRARGPLWLRREVADGVVLLRRRTPWFQARRIGVRYLAMRRSMRRVEGAG